MFFALRASSVHSALLLGALAGGVAGNFGFDAAAFLVVVTAGGKEPVDLVEEFREVGGWPVADSRDKSPRNHDRRPMAAVLLRPFAKHVDDADDGHAKRDNGRLVLRRQGHAGRRHQKDDSAPCRVFAQSLK